MRPNILLIAVDDLFDYVAFRTAFGVTIRTPNLDRLAARSVRFAAAYCAVPVCNASRAATLTGYSPNETGVFHNSELWYEAIDPADSLPAILRDFGYHTVNAGKVFHPYDPQPGHVNDRLFSEAPVRLTDTLDLSKAHDHGGIEMTVGVADQDEGFYDHKVSTFGQEFLARYSGRQPFALMLGYKHPHNPYVRPDRFWDMYPRSQVTVPSAWSQGSPGHVSDYARSFLTNGKLTPTSFPTRWQATVAGYLAGVSHVDENIGRVLDALEASRFADDTAIVLFTDHGYHLGDKDHFHKFTLWEESGRAPLMVSPAGGLPGRVETTPVGFIDLFKTVLELAGAGVPDRRAGQSLMPLVMGRPEDFCPAPVLTQCYGSYAIRRGAYRFIRYVDGAQELYDVEADPAQTLDLLREPGNEALQAEMLAELVATVRRHGAILDLDASSVTGTGGRDIAVATAATQRMALGAGDDIYIVSDPATEIIEEPGGGHDRVIYSALGSFTVPDHVEEAHVGLPVSRDADGKWTPPEDLVIHGNDQGNLITLHGVSGTVWGGMGNDTIRGAEWAPSILNGGRGDDLITGGMADDRLFGGEGDDTIHGLGGHDFIRGGAGNDLLFGGRGNDTLVGGADDDTLSGGPGSDTFVFTEGDGNDLITDFDPRTDRLVFNLGLDDPGGLQVEREGDSVVFRYGTGDSVRARCLSPAAGLEVTVRMKPR